MKTYLVNKETNKGIQECDAAKRWIAKGNSDLEKNRISLALEILRLFCTLAEFNKVVFNRWSGNKFSISLFCGNHAYDTTTWNKTQVELFPV